MKNTISPNIVCSIVVITSAIISYFHMVYTADSIASVTGYFISLAIVPIFIGGLIGGAGTIVLREEITKNMKAFLTLSAIGSIASLLPIAYGIWVMSQPDH